MVDGNIKPKNNGTSWLQRTWPGYQIQDYIFRVPSRALPAPTRGREGDSIGGSADQSVRRTEERERGGGGKGVYLSVQEAGFLFYTVLESTGAKCHRHSKRF